MRCLLEELSRLAACSANLAIGRGRCRQRFKSCWHQGVTMKTETWCSKARPASVTAGVNTNERFRQLFADAFAAMARRRRSRRHDWRP